MISIIDYGMGNVGSIRNMLAKVGAPAQVVSDPESVAAADKLILPGVGAFDNAMERLKQLDLLPALEEGVTHRQVPILGLCLGMHLFCRQSEEGEMPGLGWVDATVKRFDLVDLPVPHMGWNRVAVTGRDSVLSDPPDGARFYFAHSYHVVCSNRDEVVGVSEYGHPFHSGFQSGNILGLQFHPEKSHRFGMHVLRGFAEL